MLYAGYSLQLMQFTWTCPVYEDRGISCYHMILDYDNSGQKQRNIVNILLLKTPVVFVLTSSLLLELLCQNPIKLLQEIKN